VLEAPAAAPTAPGELVFTDEQLTLLGDLAGEPGFPGARRPPLDRAAWAAVAQGLAARGVIHDDEPGAGIRLTDAALGVALHADRWLWITVHDAQDDTRSGQDILWLAGSVAVRQLVTASGFHHFSAGKPGDLLATVASFFTGAACGQPGAPRPLAEAELEQLYADALHVMTCDCSRRTEEGVVEGQTLTLVETADDGLCLLDTHADGSVVLAPMTPEGARQRVESLAATLG
jgi:hypothetical protein